MSARRRYTIECDGPECDNNEITESPWVDEARSTLRDTWWKLGEPKMAALDFCTKECEDQYQEAMNAD